MITLYGIAHCDTVRKARAWLVERGLEHTFHDYRKAGVDPARLAQWAGRLGWEALLNQRGTTFRKLPEAARANLEEAGALALMAAQPTLIRRPVVEHRGGVLVGFAPAVWDRVW